MSSKIHADYDKVVTKKDLTKVFLREITYEHTWNYERMGNVGFLFFHVSGFKETVSG